MHVFSYLPFAQHKRSRLRIKALPVIYSGMAMVSKPGLATLIMNILFTLKPPPIPIKSFIHDKEAREWLKQFV
jgi:hypothetical protein